MTTSFGLAVLGDQQRLAFFRKFSDNLGGVTLEVADGLDLG